MDIYKSAIIILLITTLLSSSSAQRYNGVQFTQGVGVSVNPLGLMLDSRVYYSQPLFKHPGILWESTKIDAGIQNDWTPTDEFVGPFFIFEPIAIFDVFFRIGPYFLYDFFGYGHYPMVGSNSAYDDNARDTIKSDNTAGYWLRIAPTLKLKFKSIILANTFTINHIALNKSGMYLEMRSYLIHRSRDTDISNDTYLLYEINDKLITGLSYRYIHVSGTQLNSQTLSVIGAISCPFWRFDIVRLIVKGGIYLHDPLMQYKPFVQLLISFEKHK